MPNLPPDVRQALKSQVPKLTRKDLEKRAREKFKQIKAELISEFLNDPVTQEIMQGPQGVNISGTLGGQSNLFAFIVFSQGQDPIAPILALFNDIRMEYSKPLRNRGLGIRLKVNLPLKEEVFAITPMPWSTGRSWAEGIERGISGLGHLLRKNKGRSGAAVQTSVKVRSGSFQNRPYISQLLKKYKKRFEDLK